MQHKLVKDATIIFRVGEGAKVGGIHDVRFLGTSVTPESSIVVTA